MEAPRLSSILFADPFDDILRCFENELDSMLEKVVPHWQHIERFRGYITKPRSSRADEDRLNAFLRPIGWPHNSGISLSLVMYNAFRPWILSQGSLHGHHLEFNGQALSFSFDVAHLQNVMEIRIHYEARLATLIQAVERHYDSSLSRFVRTQRSVELDQVGAFSASTQVR